MSFPGSQFRAFTKPATALSAGKICGIQRPYEGGADEARRALLALTHTMRETGMKFRALGATKTLEHVAFERTS